MKNNKIIIVFLLFASLISVFVFRNVYIKNFLQTMENKTFDIRQNLLSHSGKRIANKDIVIIAIDDGSYEYIIDNYGEWPLRRDIYAKIIDYIQTQKPKSIAFDLMFVKSMKSSVQSDKILAQVFKKYDNVYTAMNLDNQSEDVRIAQDLPQNLSVNIADKARLEFLEYTNCRTVLSDILYSTTNIGMINVSRNDDGVLRKMPLFLSYKDNFYPQLGLKVALDYLGQKNRKDFDIDKNSKIKIGEKKFYLDKDGSLILIWYGGGGTYLNIPMYRILRVIEGKEKNSFNFKNKIVYFGATASSLFDIKTVPTDKVYPGVEVQATYVNNLIDGSAIHKISPFGNFVIALLLVLLTVYFIVGIAQMTYSLSFSFATYILYIFSSYYLMKIFNIWADIVFPITLSVTALIISVLVKYFIKSKDFDYQYKLATTDGLTELYNHRYFQEQMKRCVDHCTRYNEVFSLIIIDIDYFKKFNDNYGHQSGDAVLKQVANILKRNVRSSDIVCRYGGEEMSIILPNTASDEAVGIAQKLCKIVAEKKFQLSNSKESNVTISLGVSTYPTDGNNSSSLIEKADSRLYDAKNNGRNRVN